MSIMCTFGDSARLRELPGRPGVLTKLGNHEAESIVDRFRLGRFVKAITEEIIEYEKVLLALGKKFGQPNGTVQGSYVISPEHQAEFDSELRKLNSEPREIVAANILPISAYEKANLTPIDLLALGSFIVQPTDDLDVAPPK